MKDFSFGDLEFTFDGKDPYRLHYKGYGRYEGCKCEGSVNKDEVWNFITSLSDVYHNMYETIKYKGQEFTLEDIEELCKLVEKKGEEN